MTTFALRLQKALDSANMKATDLHKATGISKSTISEYLSGNYEPKQRNIYKMANALHVAPSYLMGVNDTPSPSHPVLAPTTPAGSPAMDSSAPGGTQGSAEGADEQPPQQKEYVELHRIIDNLSHEDVKELLNSARYKQNLADKTREYVDDPDDF